MEQVHKSRPDSQLPDLLDRIERTSGHNKRLVLCSVCRINVGDGAEEISAN
jgi:hypothetical protein